MKRFAYSWLILAALILPGETKSYSQATSDCWVQAENVLNEYFTLLRAGDTNGILNIITGPFLKSRERALKQNPAYANFLRERYKDFSYSIDQRKVIGGNKLAFDLVMAFSGQEKAKARIILLLRDDNFKIYSEEEIY
jgi:hypothetical protein